MVSDSNRLKTAPVEDTMELKKELFRHLDDQMPVREIIDFKIGVGEFNKSRQKFPIKITIKDPEQQFYRPELREKFEYMISEVCSRRLPKHCYWLVYWEQ